MSHRIVMNIVHMPNQIGFISNLMFPKAPLPDCLFSFVLTGL
ncbi:hypothetical protein O77CONTIG1_00079 [Leptolyngbya sp. O-77]|nr:hypothetical protein O77CONTIG1_00079 [Leptolyngbya sp. O-77]